MRKKLIINGKNTFVLSETLSKVLYEINVSRNKNVAIAVNEKVVEKTPKSENFPNKRRKNHNPESHKFFWCAFLSLRNKQMGNTPEYSETWNEVYHDCKMNLKDDDLQKLSRRDYDTNEIIDFITLHDHPNPRIEWGTELDQGTYKLSSFKSLLTRLKNKPPF